jgi:hypothetical protein
LVLPGLPGTNDGQFHLYRLFFLHESLRTEGSPGRWLADVAYGYGAPIFNYYAPASYLPGLAAVLAGTGYVAGLEVAFGFAVALSALAMFVLARSLFGLISAIVAGLVYAYLPYQLLDLYIRGALAESMAFVWLPLVPWCLLRLRADPAKRAWPAALALATAALVVTHNITSLLALPAFTALALVLGWPGPGLARSTGGAYLARAALGMALGIGLGAAYWLPALVEKGLVQADEALIPREQVLTYFVQSWPPFQTDLTYDYRNLGGADWADTKIGIVQVVTAAAGALALLRTRRGQGIAPMIGRRLHLWAVGLFLVAWGLQFRVAAPFFEQVPLVSYIQFPWRLLSLVGLATAILAGAFVQLIPPGRGVRVLVGGALVALSAYAALARLSPEYTFVEDRFVTAEGLLRNEQADFSLGTTVFGEFLPHSLPYHGTDAIRRAVLDADDRDPSDEPEPIDFTVRVHEWTPSRLRALVEAPRADRLLVHQLFFPGWQATVDGTPTAVSSGGRLGILALDIPAGVHEVELRFGWTPPRLLGWSMTLAALALLVALTVRSAYRRRVAAPAAALVVAIGVAGLLGWCWSPQAESGDDRRQEVGEHLVLIRSAANLRRLPNDGLLTVELDWLSRAQQQQEYDAWIRVSAADGSAHEGRWAYGSLTGVWDRGELVRTKSDLRLPASLPDGPARLALILGRRERRDVADVQEIDLGTVTLPRRDGAPRAPRFAVEANRDLLESLQLISYELRVDGALGRTTLRPGDALDVNLGWRIRRPSLRDVNAVAELRGGRSPISSSPRNVGEWFHPFLGWQIGDELGQQLHLVVPSDADPGVYEVRIRLTNRRRAWARPGPDAAASSGDDESELRFGSLSIQRR